MLWHTSLSFTTWSTSQPTLCQLYAVPLGPFFKLWSSDFEHEVLRHFTPRAGSHAAKIPKSAKRPRADPRAQNAVLSSASVNNPLAPFSCQHYKPFYCRATPP